MFNENEETPTPSDDTTLPLYIEITREMVERLSKWSQPVQVMCKPSHRPGFVQMIFRTVQNKEME